jgi:hypothetical protein
MRRNDDGACFVDRWAMLAVGIVLVAVWVIMTSYGTTFEMIEDRLSGWLGDVLGKLGSR